MVEVKQKVNRFAWFIGATIGLFTLPVIVFILVQFVAVLLALMLDSIKGVAFLLQFPVSMWVFLAGRKR